MSSTRRRRIANGLCGDCGNEPLTTKARGARCIAALKEFNAQRYESRKEAGRCAVCNWPAKPGCVRCEECLLANSERATQYANRIKRENAALRALLIGMLIQRGINASAICD